MISAGKTRLQLQISASMTLTEETQLLKCRLLLLQVLRLPPLLSPQGGLLSLHSSLELHLVPHPCISASQPHVPGQLVAEAGMADWLHCGQLRRQLPFAGVNNTFLI